MSEYKHGLCIEPHESFNLIFNFLETKVFLKFSVKNEPENAKKTRFI